MHTETKAMLNLGCGSRYFEDWVNVDFQSSGTCVRQHNLLEGIPYSDNTFDVVYHSHVLEHFSKEDAVFFIRECRRVLRKKGILRVVVPDLEGIVKEYLKNLNEAKKGNEKAFHRYNWSMLELYDQTVRVQGGGDILKLWSQQKIPEESYIAERMGGEFYDFKKKFLSHSEGKASNHKGKVNLPGSKWLNLDTYKNKILKWAYRDPKILEYIRIGKFRSGGQVHQWMYDEFSLGKLLKDEGFSEVKKKDAFTSEISDWNKYQWLDVENGQLRKPDSLYMEGVK